MPKFVDEITISLSPIDFDNLLATGSARGNGIRVYLSTDVDESIRDELFNLYRELYIKKRDSNTV